MKIKSEIPAILTAIGIGIIYYISKQNEEIIIDVEPVRCTKTESSSSKASVDAAIKAIYQNGSLSWSDSSKEEAAEKIVSVAKNASDASKALAIDYLAKLSQSVWSDSSKSRITNLIQKLV